MSKIILSILLLIGGHVYGENVLQAQSKPLLRLQSWPLNSIEISSTSKVRNLRKAFSAKPNSFCAFSPLKGSKIKVIFKKPHYIGLLGFRQGGWGNWAQPKELELTINGKEKKEILLALLCGDNSKHYGLVQSVPLNKIVSELIIKVRSVYRKGPGLPGMQCPPFRIECGGFAGIGEADFMPIKIDFAKKPLSSKHTGLELELKSPIATTATVIGKVFSARTHYSMPDICIKPGIHKYYIRFSDLNPMHNYGLSTNPIYVRELKITGKNPNIPVEMLNCKYIPELTQIEDKWFSLPLYKAPEKEINGKLWREGMSYSSAGRFANSTYNGLLNETVMDNWFQVYIAGLKTLWSKMQFDLHVDGLPETSRKLGDKKPWQLNIAGKKRGDIVKSNWVMMKHSQLLKGGGTFTSYCGIMAPGFLLESSNPISISSRYGGTLPVRSGAPNENEKRFFTSSHKGKVAAIGPSGILTCNGFITKPAGSINMSNLKEPWIVALWGIKNPNFWNDRAVGILFTFDNGRFEWDKEGVKLPKGMVGISSAFHGLLPSGWKSDNVSKRAKLLTKMLRTYPIECKEWYRVENDRIDILNTLKYLRWGSPQWQAADYAPIPPIVSWAKDSRKWAQLTSLKTTGNTFNTSVGPYRWTNGNTVKYSLPYYEIKTAAFPRRPEYNENCKRMSEEFIKRFETVQYPTWQSWRTLYFGGWIKAILGASLLEEGARKKLLDFAAKNLLLSFNSREWLLRHELFTDIHYVASGWGDVTVSPMMLGDASSCFGLAGYGLYQYCKYSGDWELAKKLWPRLMDMMRYTEVCNDWAVPTTTARESTRFSNIDMDTIGYLGLCGVERMAKVLGHEKDRKRAAYVRTKVGLAAALRLNFINFLDPTKKRPELYVSGFTENSAAIEIAKTKSIVVRDHIAMMFSWTGEQAEYINFLMDALSPEFIKNYEGVFLDKYVSDWRIMPVNKSRSATHIAVRAWLPDWPHKKLENDYRIWLKNMKRKVAYPSAWMGGMYGIYMNQQEKIFLMNWEPAKLGTLEYEPKYKMLTAQLKCRKAFILRLYSPYAVKLVKIDGKSVKLEIRPHKKNIFDLNIPKCDKQLEIQFVKRQPELSMLRE